MKLDIYYLASFLLCKLLDTNLISVYYYFMIQAHQINSVSKNNFLSLMKLYEKNYYLITNLINTEVININNLNKDPNQLDKKRIKITRKKINIKKINQ